ncbi:histidine phosphatase family protein [uncultured Metabacillus sp.]|uniref:histidine phosphatase family protein n=1 Tax=uncultured Metabacillus sp. TaxID=2860135 RepID=UPI0026029616|nr:histidine phosphatase family protein [uncultured Metabacillus sp.]
MGTFHSMDVYFVRHGITRWNLEKRYMGHSDEPLLEQELHILNQLRRALESIDFDFYYCSDLKRCLETFRYLLPNKLVCLDSRLREIHFGEWEGLTYEDLKGDHIYQAWLADFEKNVPPKGETLQQFTSRINTFLAELQSRQTVSNSKTLIVTHGGVIRAIMKNLDLISTYWDIQINHGTAYCLSFYHQRGEWICNSWSEVPIQEKES